MIAELALTDPEPDRASPESMAALRAKLSLTPASVTFLSVDFAQLYGWRSHPYLCAALDAHPHLALWPEPLVTAEWSFDPVTHFRDWRARDKIHQQAKADHARQMLAALEGSKLCWEGQAAALNEGVIRTYGGRRWTAENIRKSDVRDRVTSGDDRT